MITMVGLVVEQEYCFTESIGMMENHRKTQYREIL